MGDDPVLPQQRHHVGDGGQSAEINLVHGESLPAQRPRQLPGCGGAAEAGEGIVPQQRVDHHIGLGQYLRGLVVIGDNHPHAQLPGQRHLGNRGDATVHRQQQFCLGRQLAHGLLVDAIPFLMAVRDVDDGLQACRLQGLPNNHGGAQPIHVVVAVDNSPGMAVPQFADHLHSLGHPCKQLGIMQPLQGGRKER